MNRIYSNAKNARTPLTNEALLTLAPSIFARQAITGVSSRYSFIPTIQIIDGLRSQGWVPVSATQQSVRNEDRAGFQKHMIRFQQPGNQALTVGDSVFELSMVNSHDRSSGYQLMAALYRLVCSNGLMASDSVSQRISVAHTGLEVQKVIEASTEIVRDIPLLQANVASMQTRRLTPAESRAFAESALILRYDDLKESPVTADQVLNVRRHDDTAPTLWNALNTVQENLIRGGQRGVKADDNGRLQRRKTRAVKSINEDIRLNRALWHLADVLNKGANPVAYVGTAN